MGSTSKQNGPTITEVMMLPGPDRPRKSMFYGYLEFLERIRHDMAMTGLKKAQDYHLTKWKNDKDKKAD